MVTKDEAARTLVRRTCGVDDGIVRVYRLIGPAEDDPAEPIKLLTSHQDAKPVGFLPLGFKPMPALGVPYHYIMVEVSPGELLDVQGGRLELPRGWVLGEELPRPETEPTDEVFEEWAGEPEPV